MKTTLKRYEHLAVEHAKRFSKAWDYYCVATGAYLAGYRAAKSEAISKITVEDMDFGFIAPPELVQLGDELVEKEVLDGEHQLSIESFVKYKKEVENLPFKEALTTLLTNYEFHDIRVDVNSEGVVSFQGTAHKKD